MGINLIIRNGNIRVISQPYLPCELQHTCCGDIFHSGRENQFLWSYFSFLVLTIYVEVIKISHQTKKARIADMRVYTQFTIHES